MDENQKPKDILTEQLSRFMTGWAVSLSILEDYSEVVSKIEGSDPEEIKARIMKRADERFNQAKDSLTQK